MIINSYLLLLYAAVPKKKKFTKCLIYRETLNKALFIQTIGVVATDTQKTSPVAKLVNTILPPEGLIP